MNIEFSNGLIKHTAPEGDDIARAAAEMYGFILNTPATCNKSFSASEFADMIAEVYCTTNPRTAFMIKHLKSL